MDQTTAQEILNVLTKSSPLTIAEISQHLNRTKADIRYHVSRFVKSGQIKPVPPSAPGTPAKAGRPAQAFTVSDQLYPDNMKELMQTWFLLSGLTPETLQTAAQFMAGNFSATDRSHPSLFQTMKQRINELNQRHYNAHWEIKPSGPVIYFHNCPYKSLVSQNPQLCQFDQYLLSALTGATVQTAYTIAVNNKNRCMFPLKNIRVN